MEGRIVWRAQGRREYHIPNKERANLKSLEELFRVEQPLLLRIHFLNGLQKFAKVEMREGK